ncbi:MAG: FAD-binding oxidoreductase, partial [Luminiphilus sp.]
MIAEQLAEIIGAEQVLADAEALAAYRFDRWCLKHWQDWRGEALQAPACVVRPRDAADIQGVVRYASDHQIAIVPWGLGSGVCGGIEPEQDQILIDMSAMNRIVSIDEENLLLTVEAGVNGLVAEEAVAERGMTIGHWPQSIAISSVGGWISTRASGQFSTAYGNIEDIVYSLEMVLPNGELVTLGKAPRAAAGPDLRHLALGAEGTHGIVTSVTLSLRRQPETRCFSAWYCADMASGFAAQREIVQQDWRPPVMRQYDASEVARLFPDYVRDERCLILLVHEGPRSRIDAEMTAIESIMTMLGLTAADASAAEGWMSHRNNVPEWR